MRRSHAVVACRRCDLKSVLLRWTILSQLLGLQCVGFFFPRGIPKFVRTPKNLEGFLMLVGILWTRVRFPNLQRFINFVENLKYFWRNSVKISEYQMHMERNLRHIFGPIWSIVCEISTVQLILVPNELAPCGGKSLIPSIIFWFRLGNYLGSNPMTPI